MPTDERERVPDASGSLTLESAARLWDPDPGYLNTSSFGLPPRPAWDALQRSLADWRSGRTSWEGWATSVDESRARYAGLVGVDPTTVATGASVSQLLAPVAAAIPGGSVVLVPDIEFTSNVFPWAVHADRGVSVRTAPVERFLESVAPDVDVVAWSAVQSASGQVADSARIGRAARAVGALSVLDATQATGWLPVDASAVDLLVGAAYKWLCSPRGTGFLVHHPLLAQRHPDLALKPLAANWFAGKDVHESYYGLPLRLADDARRFDISPAWHCWVGTAPALRVLGAVGVDAINAHNVGLANTFLTEMDQPPSNSAIVSVPADDTAVARLHAAGVRFGMRAGRVRVAFHVYSNEDDVERAVRALRG